MPGSTTVVTLHRLEALKLAVLHAVITVSVGALAPEAAESERIDVDERLFALRFVIVKPRNSTGMPSTGLRRDLHPDPLFEQKLSYSESP